MHAYRRHRRPFPILSSLRCCLHHCFSLSLLSRHLPHSSIPHRLSLSFTTNVVQGGTRTLEAKSYTVSLAHQPLQLLPPHSPPQLPVHETIIVAII
ncbi:hypothetical protein SDJN03_23746, partial [Cucurbita argyrosperma subsp. sororia]